MQLSGHINRESLMTLEAYSVWRQANRQDVMAYRQRRTLRLGEHMVVQFESELSVRYQIQEMLRIERTFEPSAIQDEIDAYAPLMPTGTHWKATLMLAYADADLRREALAALVGVEDRVYVQVEGFDRVYPVADEDLPRQNAGKTAAVHFLRWELMPGIRAAVRAGASVRIGCDHGHCPLQQAIGPEMLVSLAGDLQA